MFPWKRVYYFFSKLKLEQVYECSVETPKFQANDDNDDYKSVTDSSFAH